MGGREEVGDSATKVELLASVAAELFVCGWNFEGDGLDSWRDQSETAGAKLPRLVWLLLPAPRQ